MGKPGSLACAASDGSVVALFDPGPVDPFQPYSKTGPTAHNDFDLKRTRLRCNVPAARIGTWRFGTLHRPRKRAVALEAIAEQARDCCLSPLLVVRAPRSWRLAAA